MSCYPNNGSTAQSGQNFTGSLERRTVAAIRLRACESFNVDLGGNNCGDLLVDNGQTFVRLKPGADGTVLTADSSAPNCLTWTPGGGGGGLTAVANVGAGTGEIYRDEAPAGQANLRTLLSTSTVTASTAGDEVTLDVVPVFSDALFSVFDAGDPTASFRLDVQGSPATALTLRISQTSSQTAILPDLSAPSDTVVFENQSQTLTNKTALATSNSFRATALGTTGANVSIAGSAPPAALDVLVADGLGSASWQPAPSAGESNVLATTGTGTSLIAIPDKVGVQLKLRTVASSDGSLTIDNSNNQELDLAVDPAALTFVDTSFEVVDAVDDTIFIGFDAAGTTGTGTTIAATQNANQTAQIPNLSAASDTFLFENETQTLTNKTGTDTSNAFRATGLGTTGANVAISTGAQPSAGQVLSATNSTTATWQDPAATFLDTQFAVQDAVDQTIEIAFDAAGTTGTRTTIAATQNANQTAQIPDLSLAADTFVFESQAQTLTNKVGTATTNSFRATQLATTGANVVISTAAPPSAGQALIATGATTATWQAVPAGALTNYEVTSTAVATTTSTSYILLPGMTVTPAAGTYKVTFSCYALKANSGNRGQLALFNNGVETVNSNRVWGTPSNDEVTVHTQSYETVTGVETIEIRYRRQSGSNSITVQNRSLELIKIA